MDKVLTEEQTVEAEKYWRAFEARFSDAEVYLCEALATEGRFESLIWAHGQGFQFTNETCARAAFGGRFEILKWLRQKGCPWNEGVCARAAAKGRLEILKWLREEGCPWDEFSVSHAAGQGQFETVRWLVENGCPWTQFAMQRAQTKEIGDYLNRAAQRLTPSSWIVFVDAHDVPTMHVHTSRCMRLRDQAVAPLVQCWREAIPGMHLFPTSARWFEPETNLEKISAETGVPVVALKDFRKDKACFGMSSFFTEVYQDPEYHVIEGLAIDQSLGPLLALEHACLCKVVDGKVVFTFDLVRRNPLFVYGVVVRRDMKKKITELCKATWAGYSVINGLNYVKRESCFWDD